MVGPLMVLAALSVVGGFMGVPHASWIEHWLEPVIPAHEGAGHVAASMEWILMGVSVLGALLGMGAALKLYSNLSVVEGLKSKFAWIHRGMEHKWYVDELFEKVIVKPIYSMSMAFWKGFDVAVIDRVVLGFGRVSFWAGQTVRVIQTGSIQLYAFVLILGMCATVGSPS
jgi:NADH-quinone oxidoreductase subunit L